MAKLVLTNCRTFLAGADLTTDTNEVTITAKRDSKDVTNFGSNGWKELIAGLGQAEVMIKGYNEASATPLTLGLPDDTGFAQLALLGGITVCPAGAADQAIAYLTNCLEVEYDAIQGKVGDVLGFSLSETSSWPLVRGVIATPPGTAITVSGNGTGNNLGAVAAGKQIYADLHVLSVAGTTPSLTVTIQSAAANTFASPTTRLTFNAATGIGGQVLRAAGPITDTWWRAVYTVSGTTPSFLAAVSFGIA